MGKSPVEAVCWDSAFRNQTYASAASRAVFAMKLLQGICGVFKVASAGMRAVRLVGLADGPSIKAS
jgi:hypothetical protein